MKVYHLAQKSGLSTSTIYEYIKAGILHPALKTGPTKSAFNESHLNRLETIRQLKKNEKLTLSEIKERLNTPAYRQTDLTNKPKNIKVQIIDTALEMFSRNHYENIKINDIAHALNMGSGTFYKYFKSKEELFLDCLERIPKVLVPKSAWDEVKNEKDYFLRLKKRGYAMLNAFPGYIGILNHVKLSLASDDEKLSQRAAQCLNSLVAPLIKDIEAAIEEGNVRSIDPELASYILLGINESFAHRLLVDSKYTVEKGFSAIENFIAHALSPDGINTNQKNQYRLKDISNGEIIINTLKFNGKKHIKGSLLEGILKIQISKISKLKVINKSSRLLFEINLNNNKTTTIEITGEAEFSGETFAGKYSIPAEKIQLICLEKTNTGL